MNYYDNMVEINQSFPTWVIVLVLVLVVLEITLKGMALWRAARNQSKGWFIVFLFINTIGILPLIYLLASNNPNSKAPSNIA